MAVKFDFHFDFPIFLGGVIGENNNFQLCCGVAVSNNWDWI